MVAFLRMDIKTVAGGIERCRFGFFRLWRYEEELSVKKFERERENGESVLGKKTVGYL